VALVSRTRAGYEGRDYGLPSRAKEPDPTPHEPNPEHSVMSNSYLAIVRLWESAWAEFTPFLAFDKEIRSSLPPPSVRTMNTRETTAGVDALIRACAWYCEPVDDERYKIAD
jgi:hypothetical protein